MFVDGGLRALALAIIASNALAWAFAHTTAAHYRKLAAWLRRCLFPRLPRVDNLMESSKS
jgi:ABC-type cobalamin transport system permease subunit